MGFPHITFIPIVNFPHPLLYDWLDLLRSELCLRNAAVIVGVDPGRGILHLVKESEAAS